VKIAVCVKHVPDTAATIKVSGEGVVETVGIKFIMNPYDEFAVEEALRIREKSGGEVVLVTVGSVAADATLRAGLAMGADRGIHVSTPVGLPDPSEVARSLADAIRGDGSPDLILTGMRSIDADGWQVPYRIAARLGWPVVSGILKLDLAGTTVTVRRAGQDGDLEVLTVPLPCVLGATRGLNQPRYPKLPDIMGAKKKAVKVIPVVGMGPLAAAFTSPPPKPPAQVLEGDVDAAARELVRLLRTEARVI